MLTTFTAAGVIRLQLARCCRLSLSTRSLSAAPLEKAHAPWPNYHTSITPRAPPHPRLCAHTQPTPHTMRCQDSHTAVTEECCRQGHGTFDATALTCTGVDGSAFSACVDGYKETSAGYGFVHHDCKSGATRRIPAPRIAFRTAGWIAALGAVAVAVLAA